LLEDARKMMKTAAAEYHARLEQSVSDLMLAAADHMTE
jgi:hypothetical protein